MPHTKKDKIHLAIVKRGREKGLHGAGLKEFISTSVKTRKDITSATRKAKVFSRINKVGSTLVSLRNPRSKIFRIRKK